jgi:hypothetical protein
MPSRIRPLPVLRCGNKDLYEQLMFDNGKVYAIPEDYSFEEILVYIIKNEIGAETLEESKQELIAIVKSIDVGEIRGQGDGGSQDEHCRPTEPLSESSQV